MSETNTTELADSGAVPITPPARPAFIDPEGIPWSPWVMPGTEFKLLNINPITGGFSLMMRVSANNDAPIHGHIGSVEGVILKGGFSYQDDHGRAGDYVHEQGGINHKPNTGPDGMEMFAVVHAPLCGYKEDGSIEGVVDAKLMYQLAKANGAADHIAPPDHWTDI